MKYIATVSLDHGRWELRRERIPLGQDYMWFISSTRIVNLPKKEVY